MKAWIFVPIALLTGLVIGGWGPRSDLLAARRELDATRNMLRETKRGRGDLGGITRLIGIDGRPGARAAGTKRSAAKSPTTTPQFVPVEGGVSQDSAATNAAVDQPSTGSVAAAAVVPPAAESTADAEPAQGRHLKDQIDTAMDLWKTRSDIARATVIANLGLTQEEALQFDVLVAAMNKRIGHSLNTLAEGLKRDEQFTEESAIRVANEVTSAIVLGYSDMDRNMPKGWRERTGEEFSMTDFIDPSVAKPLIPVEGKLEDGPNMSRGRRNRRFGPPERARGHVTVEVK